MKLRAFSPPAPVGRNLGPLTEGAGKNRLFGTDF